MPWASRWTNFSVTGRNDNSPQHPHLHYSFLDFTIDRRLSSETLRWSVTFFFNYNFVGVLQIMPRRVWRNQHRPRFLTRRPAPVDSSAKINSRSNSVSSRCLIFSSTALRRASTLDGLALSTTAMVFLDTPASTARWDWSRPHNALAALIIRGVSRARCSRRGDTRPRENIDGHDPLTIIVASIQSNH
jgi:hypothetical protein